MPRKAPTELPVPVEVPEIHPISMNHQLFQRLPCYDQILARIKGGYAINSVRSFIQDDHRIWLDVPPQEVIRRVTSLRAELAKIDIVEPFLPGHVEAAAKVVENRIDAIEEMAELIRIQKKRIQKGIEFEERLPVTNRYTGMELRIQKELISTYFEMTKKIAPSTVVEPTAPSAGAPLRPPPTTKQLSQQQLSQVLRAFNAVVAATTKKTGEEEPKEGK